MYLADVKKNSKKTLRISSSDLNAENHTAYAEQFRLEGYEGLEITGTWPIQPCNLGFLELYKGIREFTIIDVEIKDWEPIALLADTLESLGINVKMPTASLMPLGVLKKLKYLYVNLKDKQKGTAFLSELSNLKFLSFLQTRP